MHVCTIHAVVVSCSCKVTHYIGKIMADTDAENDSPIADYIISRCKLISADYKLHCVHGRRQ